MAADGQSAISAPSSVGELAANCEAKLMNDAGTVEVPRGTRGELWVRGPIVMKGYWRNEAATREVLTNDGWMITGDICYVDQDNNFHVVDRKKVERIFFQKIKYGSSTLPFLSFPNTVIFTSL